MQARTLALFVLPLLGACGGGTPARDAGLSDAGVTLDASHRDAGVPVDAAALDAAPADAGSRDAAAADAATGDGGSPPDGGSAPPAPVGPVASPGHRWTLAFDDEFDDGPMMSGPTHGLEPSKWNSGWYTSGIDASSPPVQSGEAEWYGPEAITFPGDGTLHLDLIASPSSTYGKDYEGGCITTSGHFDFSASTTRTVVEARLAMPGPDSEASGYWPAFWLLSHLDAYGGTGQWPPEIDIFELFGGSTSPVAHLHTTGTDINRGFDDSDGTVDLALAMHAYTLDLSSSALTFYLDGVEQWTFTDATVIANLFAYDPMYILINFAFGGYAGSPTGTVPNAMRIDYVRVFQQD